MATRDEVVEGLFRRGEHLQLIRESADVIKAPLSATPHTRLLIAHSLAITGDLPSSRRLASTPFDEEPASASVRARAHLVLGVLGERSGQLDEAIGCYERAQGLLTGIEAPFLLAWIELHRFRLLAEGHPMKALTALLPSLRKLVHRAGDPQLNAYLHMCTAVLEGETGGFDEARRHCEVAKSLFEISDNTTLRASSLVNEGCLAVLDGRPRDAYQSLEEAKSLALRSGDRSIVSAANINLAHIYLLSGDLDQARTLFQTTLEGGTTGKLAEVGALDGLARVHLVDQKLDLCMAALQAIEGHRSKHETLPSFYLVRWAGLTRVRLLFRQRYFQQAAELLARLERDTATVRDHPFELALSLTSALVHSKLGATTIAADKTFFALRNGALRVNELEPQVYFSAASVVSAHNGPLAKQLHQRANRVWDAQGVVSMRVELDDKGIDLETARRELKAARTTPPPVPRTVETITNAIAAALDLAHSPRLFGVELMAVVRGLGCSPGVALIETRGDAPESNEQQVVVVLGAGGGKTHALVCPVPTDPVKAVLLGDVIRLAAAGVALETARRDERNRSALWPASPVEEQSGALFIAEEMKEVLSLARRVASTNAPVLITGETGTGKEVLAHIIHGYSDRAGKPFIPFNCSATPRDMLDAQLFGHRKGAFTGATDHSPGVIRAASGGTLFLDEIGETTLDLQPKLLRFLEAGEVHPIGEPQPTRVNVRVIAATNANLEALVAQGRFRDDLFYRLDIVRLHIPPLRSRREEIPVLAQHYLDKYSLEAGKHGLRLAEETVEYLVLYKWPGNVRHLANEMRRMVVLADNGAVLMPEHLSAPIAASRKTVPVSERTLEATEVVVRLDQPLQAASAHLERTMIEHAMRKCGGHMEDTAAMLGLSRKGLYLKRQRLGIEGADSAGV